MPGHKHKLSARVGRASRDIDGPDMERPEKKARKQRPCFSCEGKSPPACHKHAYEAVLTWTCTECRRLKMKCDRQGGCYFIYLFLEDLRYVHLSPMLISDHMLTCSHAPIVPVPCSNCIRRQRLAYCTRATGATDSPTSTPARTARPARLLPTQESTVNGEGNTNSAAFLDFQGAFLGCPTEPQTPQVAASPSLSNATSSLHTTAGSVRPNNENNEDNDVANSQVNDEEKSNSYGTLVMSRGGRSKYLGPTAGSEWLKDVQVGFLVSCVLCLELILSFIVVDDFHNTTLTTPTCPATP